MSVNWIEAQQKAARTTRWAVTMTKVRIRQVVSRTRWQFVTFYGKSRGECAGIVDMLAIRKDQSAPLGVMTRADALQIILIQVKGGSAMKPLDAPFRFRVGNPLKVNRVEGSFVTRLYSVRCHFDERELRLTRRR